MLHFYNASVPRLMIPLSLVLLSLGVAQTEPLAQTQCDTAAHPNRDTKGCWSKTLTNWPMVAIHASLLPDGKVLAWGRVEQDAADNATIWDPSFPWDFTNGADNSGAFTNVYFPASTYDTSGSTNPPIVDTVNSNYDVNPFCSGHVFLPDGRLFVVGGHSDSGEFGAGGDGHGLNATLTFDYSIGMWTVHGRKDPVTLREFGDLMNDGRWYPTVTALPQAGNNAARALVVSGNQTATGNNSSAQIWEEDVGWTTVGTRSLPLYPYMHLTPSGKIFNSGPNGDTAYLNLGTGWEAMLANLAVGGRNYGSSAMYDSALGKIVVMGGGAPTATAEVINLSDPSPAWRTVAPMNFARRQINAVILPDGTIVVVGGTSGSGFNSANGAIKEAEIWNPVSESWSVMNPMDEIRIYHATALLLPDATVLSAGSGRPFGDNAPDTDHHSAQILYPPYLFDLSGNLATRPVIQSAPSSVTYGETFNVTTDTPVDELTWIRFGAVTHAFDQNQRINRLSFTGSMNLIVTAPADPNVCPPGHYMLFALSNGVPSLSKIVRITSGDYESAPVVNIDRPLDGKMFPSGAVSFEARVTDVEDGDLSAVVEWDSDVDGFLGTGSPLSTTFSDVFHTITASVTDSGGARRTDSISEGCIPGGQGQPCTSSTNCCAGVGTCTGGKPSNRVCQDTGTAVCGDGVQESPEECDGGDLAGQDCISQDFTGGTLTCDGSCNFDTSQCTGGPICGVNKDPCNQNSDCCSNNCKRGICKGN